MTDRGMQRSTEQIKELVAEQATAWLVRLESPDAPATDRAEFADWLKASPAHVYEFMNAQATWTALSAKALEHLPDQETLLRLAREVDSSEVIPLHPADVSAETQPWSADERKNSHAGTTMLEKRSARRVVALAASILIIVAAGATYWLTSVLNPSRAVYQTAVGEQQAHTLPDGSTVALNTHSLARLHWSDQYRDVHLERGEALFEVAHDPARPFRVWTGKSMVRAVGTRFNVYKTHDAVMVTVLEGRVDVTADAATAHRSANTIQLAVGEQAHIDATEAVHTLRLPNPERVIDWQARRLVFEATPLAQVIEEFNRYHRAPIQLADDSLAAKRINGIFDPSDRDSLIAFLREFEDVEIAAGADVVLIRRSD